MAEIAPIRPLDEAAALDWLRSQPGGRTNLPAAELGRRWGWPREHEADDEQSRRRQDAAKPASDKGSRSRKSTAGRKSHRRHLIAPCTVQVWTPEFGGYSDDGGERPRVIPAGILHQNSGCGRNARQRAAGGGVSISCEGYDGVGAGRKVPASARPAVLLNKYRGRKYDIC